MIIYPDYYCDKVTDITLELLKKNGIKGVILDVDNTLIDFNQNLLERCKSLDEVFEGKWFKTDYFIQY